MIPAFLVAQRVLASVRNRRLLAPTAIGIAISTACNRRCWYCPQSVDPFKQRIIDPEVWRRFLERLAEYRWCGYVGLSFYNEPTLVPEIDRYVRELKSAGPGIQPILFSNGDRPEILAQCLDAGAHKVIVTRHPPSSADWNSKVKSLQDRYGKRVRVGEITVELRHDHAGRMRGISDRTFRWCPGPVMGMSLDVDGNVVTCCWDYKSEHKMGNIMQQSLADIWNNRNYMYVRLSVLTGIPYLNLCKRCLGKP